VQAKRKAATQRDYQWMLRSSAVAKLRKQAVTRITRADIACLHAEMRDTPSQANRLIAVISSLYTFLEKRGLVPDGMNPTKRTEKYREVRRERFLSKDELERLGAAIDEGETDGLPWGLDPEKPQSKHVAKLENQRVVLSPDVANAFRLLTLTGARLREILHLRWEHVDLERGLLLLPDSKTGRKTIVLNDAAIRILQGHRRVGPYVICGKDPNHPRSDLKRPWELLCRRAALTEVRIHDLRHTFASVGAGSSLGLPIVGKLLGHNQPQTTARYAHLDADPLRRASNIIGEQIDAAMRGGTQDIELEK
jgi:integrase